MSLLEILSPAGSMESLKASINANCDAMYIGGSSFGARASANNLNEEDMCTAIDYAHVHGKSLYMTINTLLKTEELKEELYNYLYRYYRQGIDAVIVQDLGVLHFVHEHFPQLPIHASTQMTLTMAQGANELKQYGVNRLVTSRELTLPEIRAIREQTDLEIESFVHGALCYSFSGQCLMSSMIGGRSGNRGRCAQTCRMTYKVKDGNRVISEANHNYILSPKDMCTIDLIPEMVEAGINSFKIEGRMKRPEYAAGVTYAYRKYLDYYLTYGKEKFKEFANPKNKEFEKDMMNLKDLYNRGGFSKGYYETNNGKMMMSMDRPNHSGVCVGKVKAVKGNQATVTLTEDVNAQDVVEFRESEKQLYEFTLKDGSPKGSTITANFLHGSGIKPGQLMYRTRNNQLLNSLGEDFLKTERKTMIQGYFSAFADTAMSFTLAYKDVSVEVTGDVVDQAKNQPTTREKIEKQLLKVNDTSFVYDHLEVMAGDDIFLPIGKLNEIRREAIAQLEQKIAQSYRREDPKLLEKTNVIESLEVAGSANEEKFEYEGIPTFTACVTEKNQISVVCEYEKIKRVYVDLNCIEFEEIKEVVQQVHASGKLVYLYLPHIFRKDTAELFEKYANQVFQEEIDGYVIRNLEEYSFVKKHLMERNIWNQKELILDYNVYIMNPESKKFWREKGVTHYTASQELTYNELKQLGIRGSDIIAYGRIPLMVSAQCIVKNVGNYCEVGRKNLKNPEESYHDGTKKLELIDRCNKSFYARNHCKFCYNTIYNGDCIALLPNREEVLSLEPQAIRLDFTFETPSQMRDILDAYILGFSQEDSEVNLETGGKNVTKGHFKRGIL